MPPRPSDPFVGGFEHDVDQTGVLQRIRSLTVTPQPNAAVFEFRTNKPTIPFVEVFEFQVNRSGQLEFQSALLVNRVFNFQYLTRHLVRVDRLDQEKRYMYRIIAVDGATGPAILAGNFTTNRRDADVYLLRTVIRTDGDGGSPGEMEFQVAWYSNENGALLDTRHYSGSFDPGEHQLESSANWIFRRTRVPEVISLYVRCREYDHLLGAYFVNAAPATLPAAPSHFETTDMVGADAIEPIRLADHGYQVNDRTLDSGPWGVSFACEMRVAVRVTDPKPMMTKSFRPAPLRRAGSLAGLGSHLTVQSVGGKQLFMLGPGGIIGWRLPRSARGRPKWAGLRTGGADWATLAARDDESVDVVVGHQGVLRHAQWHLGERNDAELQWRTIGRDFQSLTAATLADDNVALVGLGRGGEVRVGVPGRASRSAWNNLGGKFTGRVAALAVRDTLELFVLNPRGGVAHGSWSPSSPGRVRWTALGGERLVHVYVAEDGDSHRLMGVTAERQLVTVARENGRWPTRWERFGTLDDLDVVPEAGSSAKKKPGRKAPVRRVTG